MINTVSLESGTVFIECKDGAYEPLSAKDILDPAAECASGGSGNSE